MSMYEKEWECCGDVTITKSWQPEKCPFCTTPPKREWVGLTGDEVNDLKHWLDHRAQWSYIEFARAIEAKLKEKNS